MASWKGSPWEYGNVLDKMLPSTRGKIGVDVAVSDCADPELVKKYGLPGSWKQAHFRDVPERFIVKLRAPDPMAVTTSQMAT